MLWWHAVKGVHDLSLPRQLDPCASYSLIWQPSWYICNAFTNLTKCNSTLDINIWRLKQFYMQLSTNCSFIIWLSLIALMALKFCNIIMQKQYIWWKIKHKEYLNQMHLLKLLYLTPCGSYCLMSWCITDCGASGPSHAKVSTKYYHQSLHVGSNKDASIQQKPCMDNN